MDGFFNNLLGEIAPFIQFSRYLRALSISHGMSKTSRSGL
jgi:hypothetical protein